MKTYLVTLIAMYSSPHRLPFDSFCWSAERSGSHQHKVHVFREKSSLLESFNLWRCLWICSFKVWIYFLIYFLQRIHSPFFVFLLLCPSVIFQTCSTPPMRHGLQYISFDARSGVHIIRILIIGKGKVVPMFVVKHYSMKTYGEKIFYSWKLN
jgi:hypothetical protein